MLFEELIESVLRRHNIGQRHPDEQGRVIGEPKNLLGDAQQDRLALPEGLGAASDGKTG
jgi:hypothetical protein